MSLTEILIQDKSELSNYDKIEIAIQSFIFSHYIMAQADSLARNDLYNINFGDELNNFDTTLMVSKLNAEHWGYNLAIQSLGHIFIATNKAMEDKYGTYGATPLDVLPLRMVIAAGRNAFGHDPGTPKFWFENTPFSKWEWNKIQKEKRIWNFSSPNNKYSYSIDFAGKHNKILQLIDFGGIKHMFALFVWVKNLVKSNIVVNETLSK